MIIKHKKITKKGEEKGTKITTYEEGFIIYYKDSGATSNEFLYLFDSLSRFQILDNEGPIRIRAINLNSDLKIHGNFEKAKKDYANAWGFDSTKNEKLDRIEFSLIETNASVFDSRTLGWER